MASKQQALAKLASIGATLDEECLQLGDNYTIDAPKGYVFIYNGEHSHNAGTRPTKDEDWSMADIWNEIYDVAKRGLEPCEVNKCSRPDVDSDDCYIEETSATTVADEPRKKEQEMTDRNLVRIPVALKSVVAVQVANNDPLGIWNRILTNIDSTDKKVIRLILNANEMDKVFEVLSKLAQRRIGIAESPSNKLAIRAARKMVIKLWETGHKWDEVEQGVVQTEDYRARNSKKAKTDEAE
jgi:hypothetical protein